MDNQRLILFVVFSFTLLLLWESWQSKYQPPLPTPTVTGQSASAPTPSQALNAPALSAAAPSSAALGRGQRAVVETDVLRAEIDSTGGDLRALQLLLYRETEHKDQILALFEDSVTRPYVAQNGLIGAGLPTHRSVFQLTPGTYRLRNGTAQLQVPLVWTDAATGVRVEKTYTFTRGSYQVDLQTRILNGGIRYDDYGIKASGFGTQNGVANVFGAQSQHHGLPNFNLGMVVKPMPIGSVFCDTNVVLRSSLEEVPEQREIHNASSYSIGKTTNC